LSDPLDAGENVDTLNNKAGKAICTTRIMFMFSVYVVRSISNTDYFLLPHPTI
jgi:hypothetical protein